MMSKLVLPDNHFMITSTREFKEICNPLFLKTGITESAFGRLYDDGKLIIFITQPNYLNLHFNLNLPIVPPIPHYLMAKKEFYYVPETYNDKKQAQLAHTIRTELKMDHPFYMLEKHLGYIDVFCFGSIPSNYDAVNFCLNNLDILKQYKLYFKEKAECLLVKAEEHKIALPDSVRAGFTSTTQDNNLIEMRNQLVQKFIVKRYQIPNSKKAFTPREIDCLYFLGKGFTVKAIGQQLNLSPRTVEAHLNNVKTKLNCRTKVELVRFIQNQFASELNNLCSLHL